MDTNYYKSDVFITKFINGNDEYIEDVYTNQYVADQAVSNFNQKAIEKDINKYTRGHRSNSGLIEEYVDIDQNILHETINRMEVICRPLYE